MIRRRSEGGAGVVSAFVGATIFLLFLLFAAQLLLGLYEESVVAAVAYDAAREAAGGSGSVAEAEAEATRRLGSSASLAWAVDDEAVRLTVRVPRPPVMGLLRGPIERTVRVRVERVR